VENVIPDVARSPNPEPASQGKTESEFSPRPPILREEITSDMKILVADVKYPQLLVSASDPPEPAGKDAVGTLN
jgi:hypothetical protein